MEAEEILWEIKKEKTVKDINAKKRRENRDFTTFRDLELIPDFVPKAEGSCFGKLGKTQVLVGIKLETAEPYPDHPDEGTIRTGAELSPIALGEYRPGPPNEDSIEIARVVDRGIRESRMIDFKKLCIRPKELVWNVSIDLEILNNDGNLIDCASMTAVKALLGTKMLELENDKPVYGKKTKETLPLVDKPISTTFAKIGKNILIDPYLEEEKAMDCRITMVTNQKGNICAIQKGENGSFTREEIIQIAETSIQTGKQLREKNF